MRRIYSVFALYAMGLLLSTSAMAQVSLEDIGFSSLPGEMFEIELIFNQAPPTPEVFEIESPPRLSMDFSDVVSRLEERRYPLQFGIADSVMVLEAQGRTRMVVNLATPSSYSTRVQGTSMFITIGDSGSVAAAQRSTPQSQDNRTGAQGDIRQVDFRRTANGSGQIVISLEKSDLVGNVKQSGASLSLELVGAELSRAMQMRLDVVDYATPVQFIDVYAEDGNVMIVADVFGEYEYIAYQSGEEYVIDVTPVSLAASPASLEDEFPYVGERMDLNSQNIEVRAFLQNLADFNDLNLIVSDTVTGSMSIRMNDVPWDQALDLILTIRGLDKRLSGNVLYVAPAEEIASAELQVLENNIQVEALAPLITEYMDINYAVADQILLLLQGDDESEGGTNRILTSRGTASVDVRTNTLIVQDVASVILEVKNMLRRLDVPAQQVLIEARIVNASTQFSQALGVRWGLAQTFPASGDGYVISGNLGSATSGLVSGGGAPNLSFPEALMVDLGVSNASSSIALGYAGDNALIQLELSALEDSGEGEVIAQPKIQVQNLETGKIESGVQVPYQAQAGGTAGGSITEFIAAVLSLEVTPQITPDGRIIMLLDIHQDSVVPGAAGAVPAIATNALTTRVLVDDGDTVVLGGVFREEVTTTITKTPVLGDIPYLGTLFKRTEEFETKTELLIFITPSIINDVL